jgi:uncharacterized glyoxalase superfamily protein PhnB/uncharacterized damage-inducible protein DinB
MSDKTISLKDLVLDHIHTTLYEEEWQWQPSLSEALAGLTAAQAAWKPSPARHAIWQIVRHLLLWKRGVLEAWDGRPPDGAVLEADDWKEVSGGETAWDRDRQTLLGISREYLTRVQALTDRDLSRPVVWYTAGNTQPLALRLVRTTTHDIYHAGQIRYIRALQGDGPAGRRTNRSMPAATVIPVVPYPDVGAAIEWLTRAFGFTLRLRIGAHRAQLNVGDGAVVLSQHPAPVPAHGGSVMVRVDDVDGHHDRAKGAGAAILQPPTDFPYGERQYTARDLAGHTWTFSQSIADVAPEDWGGTWG